MLGISEILGFFFIILWILSVYDRNAVHDFLVWLRIIDPADIYRFRSHKGKKVHFTFKNNIEHLRLIGSKLRKRIPPNDSLKQGIRYNQQEN